MVFMEDMERLFKKGYTKQAARNRETRHPTDLLNGKARTAITQETSTIVAPTGVSR